MAQINPNNFISIKQVLSEVLVALDDEGAKKLHIGFYKARVKDALDDLSYDTFFYDHTEDTEIPVDLRLDIPAGAYNLKEAHIYTGTPQAIGYSENLYWKKGMRGSGSNYTANRVPGRTHNDPFVRVTRVGSKLLYFTIQNGVIHLSQACASFDYVRFIYSGVPSHLDIEDAQIVPPEVKEAIVLWVIEKCASYLKVREPLYRQVQADAAVQLDKYGFRGEWHKANMRLNLLDRKMLNDVIIHNSIMNY